MMINKECLSEYKNYQVKNLDTKSWELTNHNSIKVPKVFSDNEYDNAVIKLWVIILTLPGI